jgi:hypothetical protein
MSTALTTALTVPTTTSTVTSTRIIRCGICGVYSDYGKLQDEPGNNKAADIATVCSQTHGCQAFAYPFNYRSSTSYLYSIGVESMDSNISNIDDPTSSCDWVYDDIVCEGYW